MPGTQRATLLIGGMTCTACSGTIENVLREKHGVVSAQVRRRRAQPARAFANARLRLGQVSLMTNKADVVFEPKLVSAQELVRARRRVRAMPTRRAQVEEVVAVGFEAQLDAAAAAPEPLTRKATLSVGGMTCTACSGTIENALREAKGVVSAEVRKPRRAGWRAGGA
jgi:Cu+-exporting ATPase